MTPRLKALKKKSRRDASSYIFSLCLFSWGFLVWFFACLWGVLGGLVFVVVVLKEKGLGKKTKISLFSCKIENLAKLKYSRI